MRRAFLLSLFRKGNPTGIMSMTLSTLTVLGGLALFIYGMQLMSYGLRKVAGEKMRSLLYLFSKNRLVAIVAGAVVTAVLQSSSASTVMVIGFVNAGLLNLLQSTGIILGANIGTTLTAQLIAFKISYLIMPTIIAGVILSFFNRPLIKNWSPVFIGFGFLFLGMDTMSAPLKELSGDPSFIEVFKTFDCTPNPDGHLPFLPLLGSVGIGLGVTLILQSSAATIGMVFALASGGALNMYTAIAITLGANIGTTITAQLAALTANRLAKQAALFHTLFNVFGVLLFLATSWIMIGDESIFYWLVKSISGHGASLARQVANADTLFNLCFMLLVLPFVKYFARLCEKIIPQKEPEVKFKYLEPLLLDTPAQALIQVLASLRRMLKKSCKMVDIALRSYDLEDEDAQMKIPHLAEREARIDEYQHDITKYLTKLMTRPLTQQQSNVIPTLLHCTNDAERIGDHTKQILDLLEQFREVHGHLSPVAEQEYMQLVKLLRSQAECAVDLLENPTHDKLFLAGTIRSEIRIKTESFEQNHVKRMADQTCVAIYGHFFVDLLEEMRQVSRHIANVTERAGQFMPIISANAASSLGENRKLSKNEQHSANSLEKN